MSKITRNEIEETKYGRYLLSDENIYLSVYSLNSYVFEYNLLEADDRILYHRLQDKFDRVCVDDTISKVRNRIIELLDEDNYIEAKVYFKPKKISESGEMDFRPLHTTDLITQISIVSMLHLFIYEIPEEGEKSPKLRLSNLSRLIPSDFYGNRVSVKPEYLFKPWKQQYQKYNQNSNDALKKYHTSLEYKYEVTLDLKNFFPTINPIIIYHYIIGRLPAYMTEKEMHLMKMVLRKLLFCRLITKLDRRMKEQYYKVTRNINTCDNVKKQENENELKSYGFVRGIPQGLPQSYFLGNIYMIFVSEIFRKKFEGASYFYVDDSVIFTNDIQEEEFKIQLEDLNQQIKENENAGFENHKDNYQIYPKDTAEFYESNLYGVEVHLEGKSNYARLDSMDESEIYLKCISREMSQVGSDFFKMYSDEENRNLEAKLDILSERVKKKLDQMKEEEDKKEEKDKKKDTKKFKERLTRYYRFFEYRKQKLKAMHQPEYGSDKTYKEELKKIIYVKLSDIEEEELEEIADKDLMNEEKNKKLLIKFMDSYSNDIWDAAVGIYQTFADNEEMLELKKYISLINELCYKKESADYSYLERTYSELLERKKKTNQKKISQEGISEEYVTEEYLRITYDDPYKTLKRLAMIKLKNYANKHYDVIEHYSNKFLKMEEEGILKILLLENNELPVRMRVVRANTQKILRMVLNTVYSYLFNIEISDHPVLAKKSKKSLTYGELRILSFLRNPLFTDEEFKKREISLEDRQNRDTVDYSIMRVLEIFNSFVKDPVSIDKLIITHKYTCDVWKNGSKYLYFYTLHNQEHAIVLIQNIVKLIHAIDFFKISGVDYYILFLACYLHDISMVKIPAFDSFLLDTNEADQLAKELWDNFNEEFMHIDSSEKKISEMETKKDETKGDEEDYKSQEMEPDILSVKKYMLSSYKKLDGYFESSVRERHASDSAAEIRQRAEIRYLDTPMRELVAEVSEAHCADERNIYGTKSNASSQLMSIKFDKILLRLADLLDMSCYRVSKPILHHNVEQMSEESAFHWISHLLTQGYRLHTKYEIKLSEDNKESEIILAPKTIIEKLILEIYVDISQMSTFKCKNPCLKVKIDRDGISQQEITLICGKKCEYENNSNSERQCNFLCRWF